MRYGTFLSHGPNPLQFGHAIYGVNRQTEAIDLIVHRQIHGCVDVSFLLVAANVDLFVSAGVGEAMYEIWISVEVEDDRLVHGEQGIVVTVRQSMGMFRTRLQFEKIDDVNEADLQVRELLSQ